ncbi:aldo/keto reductase [Arthrobacter sp. Sa2BUA2]|uniref:Aldo/keto reductase n=1 Tax=Arthrobacter pullicola TaxID=2762224 RepID=A0ABR8YKP9_9MICC|nr:aldo/keto reductase [Arthrobacter pullicola]MBD8044815.1 aldo/keto reductase [Arthrobacter pullicola]
MSNAGTVSANQLELAPGAAIPLIGLGTWPLVGPEATDAVTRGIANGYRHVDTAEKYGNEDAVGEGIRRAGIDRAELWVTSKLSLAGHARSAVRTVYGEALKRMGLVYLDLFLIHWPNPQLDRYVETCAGLQDLVDDGLLRAWGVSNFKPTHLDRVAAEGLKPAVNQVQVDPHHLQRSQLEHHAARGIATAAYSPLGRAGAFLDHPAVTGPAAAYGKTPAQVVLRWHLDSGRVAVPKSASDARQRENLDVFDFALTDSECAAIDALDTGAGPRLDADEYGH